MKNDLHNMENKLGYVFVDKTLLVQALTHPSFDHENSAASPGSYQRLEFLGDAVLGMLLAERLYSGFPNCDEGDLSRFRSQIADQETLAEVARKFDLGEFILLGRGEEQSCGRDKDSILADVLEALIAAIYLDGGFEDAKGLISRLFEDRLSISESDLNINDSKSALQEMLSAHRLPPPQYILLEESGPPHGRIFSFQVLAGDNVSGVGSGRSKKVAQQAAAADALKSFKTVHEPN